MRVERVDGEAWADALPSTGFEVFHVPEALDVVAEHAGAELHRLVAFKGDRPVGLVPLFETSGPVGRAVLSPPPSMGIPRLGPLLMPASPKRRSQERMNRSFVEESLAAVGTGGVGTLCRLVCSTAYDDPRPFRWSGGTIETEFTYAVETDGRSADEIMASFSKSLRREIRSAGELDVDVSIEGEAGAKAVHEQTADRYRAQGRAYRLAWPYVRNLTAALRDVDRCRTYVARTGSGEYLSGVTVLYSNDDAYFWQGGARATYEDVSVNSLIHWRVVEDLLANQPRETVTRYDLMGANTERLCRYKAKFDGELVPYYVVESGGVPMRLAKRAYRLLAG